MSTVCLSAYLSACLSAVNLSVCLHIQPSVWLVCTSHPPSSATLFCPLSCHSPAAFLHFSELRRVKVRARPSQASAKA
ncbi:hypothetical protein HDV64DRAFT_256092 [Trichoderma sp. TUCIM 5745]